MPGLATMYMWSTSEDHVAANTYHDLVYDIANFFPVGVQAVAACQ